MFLHRDGFVFRSANFLEERKDFEFVFFKLGLSAQEWVVRKGFTPFTLRLTTHSNQFVLLKESHRFKFGLESRQLIGTSFFPLLFKEQLIIRIV